MNFGYLERETYFRYERAVEGASDASHLCKYPVNNYFQAAEACDASVGGEATLEAQLLSEDGYSGDNLIFFCQ